jgi:hypothetical protein
MDIYNKDKTKEKVRFILDSNYERMYPYETEKELGILFKEANENKDEKIKKEILWEIDLLNRTFGNRGTYKGVVVEEISNKWEYYLEVDSNKFTRPFSNIPFCEWKIEAVDYYKRRYDESQSDLSKARYSFAIMTFSITKEKLEWMEKSVNNWLRTAERYIEWEVYNKDYYEIPILSYELALKLSFTFNHNQLKKDSLTSLHNHLLQIIRSGEKRWYFEYFGIESRYVSKLKGFEKEKKESVDILLEKIKEFEEEYSSKKNILFNFWRDHIKILISYGVGNLFYWEKKIAESYILEANTRDDPLIRSAFLNDAIKYYKTMQGKYSDKPNQKIDIDERIESLTLMIKEENKNIKYNKIESSITIKKEDIKGLIDSLKSGDIFYNLLKDSSFIPNYQQTIDSTEEIKRKNPLGFIIPNVISKKDFPIIKYSSEQSIFDFRVRQNILIGIKISSIMIKMSLEELQEGYKIDSLKEIETLITSVKEIEDIEGILEKGFKDTFGKEKDIICGIHILIPYFEEIIRRILVKSGKRDLVLEEKKEQYFRKINLGGLLESRYVQELIGENFQNTLKVLLTDNDQLNLRQELAHGLLTTQKINEEDLLYVSYCLLRLILILKEIKTSN